MTFHPIGTLAAHVAARSSIRMRHETMRREDIEPAAAYLAVDADALRDAVQRHGADLQSLTQAEAALTAALAAIHDAIINQVIEEL